MAQNPYKAAKEKNPNKAKLKALLRVTISTQTTIVTIHEGNITLHSPKGNIGHFLSLSATLQPFEFGDLLVEASLIGGC